MHCRYFDTMYGAKKPVYGTEIPATPITRPEIPACANQRWCVHQSVVDFRLEWTIDRANVPLRQRKHRCSRGPTLAAGSNRYPMSWNVTVGTICWIQGRFAGRMRDCLFKCVTGSFSLSVAPVVRPAVGEGDGERVQRGFPSCRPEC